MNNSAAPADDRAIVRRVGAWAVNYPRAAICAGILAGGKATRMHGNDKGLVELSGRPMVCHALDALRPQAGRLLINANRNRDAYAQWGVPVVADRWEGFLGPLAGMASLMAAASTRFLLLAPCDSPMLPTDLGPRLYQALVREDAAVAVASSGKRLEPVFALLECRLLANLEAAIQDGERKIDAWYARQRQAIADFSDCAEMFANVNTPQERAAIEIRLGRAGPGKDRGNA